MRIGIVSEYYRPWPGGISEHVHHEALELRRRGHRVVVITGPARPQRWCDGGEVIRLGVELRFTSNGSLSRMVLGRGILRLRRLYRELNLDLVHVHAPLDPVLGMAGVAAAEVATVGTFHASFSPAPLWYLLYGALWPLSGAVFRRLDGCVAVSEDARRSIAHFFPGRYEVISNGVDTDRFHPEIDPVPLDGRRRPTVLFVGRPDPRKGLSLLLAAFAEVRRRVPGARLVIVGDGGVEPIDRLQKRVEPGIREDVVFVGYVAPELVPHYYAGCDVFCSPATGGESQGIVLLEAMASARPVVAFDIPGYRDVVTHGEQGWLVAPIGPSRLAEALSDLLVDSTARARMGERGRRTALRYAWPEVGRRLEDVFLDAARSARRGIPTAERPRE